MMEKTCNHQLLLILLSISSLLFCFPGSSTCQVHPPAAPPPALDLSVEQLCQKATRFSLCISTLATIPSELMDSPTAILAMAVNATLNSTQVVLADATRLLSDPSTSSDYKSYIQQCQGYFSQVIKDLQIALQAIADGDDQLFVALLNEVIEEFSNCGQQFDSLGYWYGYYSGYGSYPLDFDGDKRNLSHDLHQMAANCLDIRKAVNWHSYSY